ncbi:retrovirus-related pol polyprotein from transposon TNT 1-94 [Tanacetum coccineum]
MIVVALLKNTNFFRAFTTSSTIPAIHIQQFWDTMCFNSSTRLYSCQLDEQWFNLHKDILRDALNITPANDNNPFVAPPSSDTVIEYVNTLGYPSTLKNVSAMSVNALYQPWGAILSMINMCLTGKTAGFDKRRHPTFLTDRKNLATAARGKKKTAHLLISSVRFIKLIIHHLRTKHNIHPRTGSPLHYSHEENILNTLRFVRKDGREIFGMPIPDVLLTNEIKGAPYYGDYQEHVAKYQQFLDEERGKAEKGGATESFEPTKVTKPKKRKLVKETPDEPSPAKRSKGGLVTKKRKPKSLLKLVDEPSDEGVPIEEPTYNEEDANLQRALELSLMEQGVQTQGPARPMVIREPESGRIQPLPVVQGKGKEKVVEKHAAHDLLTLQTPQKKSLADQFIFHKCPPMPTESSTHTESPSIDAELNLTNSEIESDEEASNINVGNQEGQAGPNLGIQDKGQAGPNPGEQDKGQAGPNPDQVIIEESASSTGTLSSLQNLDKDLSFTNHFFLEKPHEEESGKTNAETKVQSMVSVPIHQGTSSVPPMTTPVIDFTTMKSDSPLPTSSATTSIIITTTAIPPTPQPQQSTTDPILVSQAVDEIVIDAVDWAMQAPLRARFRDLPTVDIKEILQQRMFEDDSYKAHTIHNDLYEALQKSLELDCSDQRLADQEEARKKRQRDVTFQELLLGLHLHRHHHHLLQQAHLALQTAASASQSMAWTTSDTRFESNDFTASQELSPTNSLMQDDSIPDEQASALATTYDPPAENSLLAKTEDMTTFLKLYCRQVNKTELTQVDFEGQAYEVVKAFYPDVIHLQFQMEECHKMLMGSCLALSISKMKAASYPDFGLELLVPEQIHDSLSRRKDVRTHMRILSVVIIKAYSRYGYDCLSETVLQRADHQEHTIAEKDFKNMYPSDFEDLNLLLLQGHLDHLSGSDKRMLSTAVKLWTRNLVIRQRVEDFQLGIESYQTQLNLTKPE